MRDPDLFAKSAQAAHQTIEVYGTLSEEEADAERVQEIGYRIAKASNFDEFPFSFYVVDMAIPNAFALPAGHIFITRGMLNLGLDDDMMAGLLGHEIAHVTERHFLRMRRRATLLNVLGQVLTAGALIAASNSDSQSTYLDPFGYRRTGDNSGDLVQGAALTSMVVTELLLRSYSRENEDEADEQGQRFAAAAGYDPGGTERLMDRMKERMPQSQEFGYWQTHPFFEERVRAAKARKRTFTIQEPAPASDYRRQTQASLLAWVESTKPSPELETFVEDSALVAWPAGTTAERLRFERLHEARRFELDKEQVLARDFGRLLGLYDTHIEAVRHLTPESEFIAAAAGERDELAAGNRDLLPEALEVLRGDVYQTEFLETFLSNHPEAPQATRAHLDLGRAYSRLDRPREAVEQLLAAWRSPNDAEIGSQAGAALRQLAPRIEWLSALATLSQQRQDSELADLAADRLKAQAGAYDSLENGADLLATFPEIEVAEIVRERLDELADRKYRQVVVSQKLGDHGKAVDGMHQILTFAPLSPAARRLGEQAVLDG